jgi:hypothetical protein
MTQVEVFTTKQAGGWTAVLEQCPAHDFYHLPAYHALAEEQGEGDARLFAFTEDAYRVALPLLLRGLDGLWPGPSAAPGARDATSVYGYAGPVCSHADVPADVVGRFQAALRGWLGDLRVVNVFSRLHPLLPQRALLAGLGDYAVNRQTVTIDLTVSPEAQRAGMRRRFREALNRLRRSGLDCVHDAESSRLDDFCGIYHETMRRVGAAERYFFPRSYFERLREVLGSRLHLFFIRREGKAVCGGLFVVCAGILQYHLGGTLDEALPLAPMKLLIDEVRRWALGQGLRLFHLGGGATASPADPLLYFKQGFSDRCDEFVAWQWVVLPDLHERLCDEKASRDEQEGLVPALAHYFPAYRCPCTPQQAPAASARCP